MSSELLNCQFSFTIFLKCFSLCFSHLFSFLSFLRLNSLWNSLTLWSHPENGISYSSFIITSLSLCLSLSFFFFLSITLLAGRDQCSVLIHSHDAHCLATTNQPSYFWRGPPANQECCAIAFSVLQSYWRMRTNGVGPEHQDEQNWSALKFWPHQCWCLEGCVNSLRLDQRDCRS